MQFRMKKSIYRQLWNIKNLFKNLKSMTGWMVQGMSLVGSTIGNLSLRSSHTEWLGFPIFCSFKNELLAIYFSSHQWSVVKGTRYWHDMLQLRTM